MVESVKELPKEMQEMMDIRIWNVKKLEGIRKKKELGVRVVPSICLNGEAVFQSGIPQEDDLITAIRKRFYHQAQ